VGAKKMQRGRGSERCREGEGVKGAERERE